MYSLLIQSIDGFSWKPSFVLQKEPNLYVAIELDGTRTHQTHTINRAAVPKWNDVFTLSPDRLSSRLSLHLYHKTSVPFNLKNDSCLATVDIDIGTLSERCGTLGTSEKTTTLELIKKDTKVKSAGTLSVRLAAISIVQAGRLEIVGAQTDIESIGFSSGAGRVMEAADTIVKVQSKGGDLASSLDVLISKIDIIVRVGDKLTKIHPYANLAWKVLMSMYKAVKQQQQTDEKIVELVRTMVTTYSFVEDIESLPKKIKGLEDTCLAIVKQTVECAIFIREYTGKGFGDRLVAQALSDGVHQQIDDLSAALNALKQSFDCRLAIHAAFVSAKIFEHVQILVDSNTLRALKPVDMNAFHRALCLAGTRVDILNFIQEWLTMPSDSGNILWLYGVAGSGKSTISTTVSEYFRDLQRLGAFLFFTRTDRAASSPSAVIRTIAYQLASSNPLIRAAISKAINQDPKVTTATSRTQFEKLLLGPLNAAQIHLNGPVIVILDALDECGDPESRRDLVSLLANEFYSLPPMFRFLITSRPDSDIAGDFKHRSRIIKMHLEISITTDIRLYIRSRMDDIRKRHELEDGWPGEDVICTLTEYSDGLFIWASTATKFVDGHRPNQKLESLMMRNARLGFNLDQLFEVALRGSGSWDDPDFALDAQAVLAAIVLGEVSMTAEMIDALFNLQKDRASKHTLNALGCVVQWSPGKVARTLHASFGDYLTDPQRSAGQPWHLDVVTHSYALTLGCFRILKNELRFNICRLKDSYVTNSDVPNLSALADTYISSQLSYACQFWASHLTKTNHEQSIQEELLQFLRNQFLMWLEVVSIQLSRFQSHRKTREKVESWYLFDPQHVLGLVLRSIPDGASSELRNLTQDCLSFIRVFGHLILEAAPHIYLSALAMTPEDSLVRREYLQHFEVIMITAGGSHYWEDYVLHHRPFTRVYSLALSPDGSYIVSGSSNCTLCIWDAETLEPLGESHHHHDSWVSSVAFSPDGSCIVSGSGDCTLCMWDAETLEPLGEPLCGHNNSVLSVAFSPDGTRILSGSRDCTLRIWDAKTLQPLGEPLCGHDYGVLTAAFSPDSSHIVSGSEKNTLCIWDANTGQLLGKRCCDQEGVITSVAFSPNGSCIVSGSSDSTVCIWDAETQQLLGKLHGHEDGVSSVAFSPDGNHIVSGSWDCTLCIWDVETRQPLGGLLRGHKDRVLSVAFSLDGTHIVSGSSDGTLHIWDMEAQSNGYYSSLFFRLSLICINRKRITKSTDTASAAWKILLFVFFASFFGPRNVQIWCLVAGS
ncbi:hypothetical protein DFH08DRAFT_856466 [Mycena albidolilacea]|uniref:WD40 repeat-like protein n=1 Tax=Mycena albidolilacea TaxID=1033008 RepID=A0AAD7AA78_9AGAR|nr:hypothetical protein DFH08DRAFT_856466 [Mycena albidolilacea]